MLYIVEKTIIHRITQTSLRYFFLLMDRLSFFMESQMSKLDQAKKRIINELKRRGLNPHAPGGVPFYAHLSEYKFTAKTEGISGAEDLTIKFELTDEWVFRRSHLEKIAKNEPHYELMDFSRNERVDNRLEHLAENPDMLAPGKYLKEIRCWYVGNEVYAYLSALEVSKDGVQVQEYRAKAGIDFDYETMDEATFRFYLKFRYFFFAGDAETNLVRTLFPEQAEELQLFPCTRRHNSVLDLIYLKPSHWIITPPSSEFQFTPRIQETLPSEPISCGLRNHPDYPS